MVKTALASAVADMFVCKTARQWSPAGRRYRSSKDVVEVEMLYFPTTAENLAPCHP